MFKYLKPVKYVLLPRSGPRETDSVDRKRHETTGESANSVVLGRRVAESLLGLWESGKNAKI